MTAQELEDSLGPHDVASSLALDERDEFPSGLVNRLTQMGFLRGFVPVELGGTLDSFEEAGARMRVVARRDLTAAVALGQCFLGAAPVWLAGSADQKKRATAVLPEGDSMALALTEEAHGSDILAFELAAQR